MQYLSFLGHSMGGALAVHSVSLSLGQVSLYIALQFIRDVQIACVKIVGLVVIDVVEGTAMEALGGMVCSINRHLWLTFGLLHRLRTFVQDLLILRARRMLSSWFSLFLDWFGIFTCNSHFILARIGKEKFV